MRQTPFGVWNSSANGGNGKRLAASMRQTPFGVWNGFAPAGNPHSRNGFNEADAFRRLEWCRP